MLSRGVWEVRSGTQYAAPFANRGPLPDSCCHGCYGQTPINRSGGLRLSTALRGEREREWHVRSMWGALFGPSATLTSLPSLSFDVLTDSVYFHKKTVVYATLN